MKTLFILSLLAIAMVACSKKEPSVTIVDNKPTTEAAIATLMRSHPHAIKVCYSAAPTEGFLFQYPAASDIQDNEFHGWYLIQTYKFFKLSNETWINNEVPNTDWIVIYPNVTDLACADNTVKSQ